MTLTFSMMQRTFWMKNKKDEAHRTSRLGRVAVSAWVLISQFSIKMERECHNARNNE